MSSVIVAVAQRIVRTVSVFKFLGHACRMVEKILHVPYNKKDVIYY